MLSKEQKMLMAKEIEKLLLSLNHPEMPDEKPKFALHNEDTRSNGGGEYNSNGERILFYLDEL